MQAQQLVVAPPEIGFILEETERMGFGMASEPLVGALLRALATSKPGGRILELGTGTGVATAWLRAGMDAAARLVTVDIDSDAQQVAKCAFGHDARVEFVCQDGLGYLAAQPSASFDLVFADAMPGKYEGLSEGLRVVRSGGFYVGDDLLPQANWPEGHAAKVPALLGELAASPDFVMVPLAWATGVVIAARK
jgi:predicted O-methyltransferase YrrM